MSVGNTESTYVSETFTALLCSDSTFNLLKRVTDGSFLFLCKH